MASSFSGARGGLLGRVRPAVTTPVAVLSNGPLRLEVTQIRAAVVPGSGNVIVKIYHNDVAAAFDSDSLIMTATMVDGGDSLVFQSNHLGSGIMLKRGGYLGVEASVANALNISVYGVSEDIANEGF